MNCRISQSFLFVLVTLALAGCQSEPAPKKPEHGYLPDSLVEAGSSTGSKAAAVRRDTLVIGTDAKPGDPNESFEQRNERLATTVFAAYSKAQLDPMEAFPNFKTATKSAFLRLRKTQPTAAPAGPKVYPRILLKSYRFAAFDALKAAFEGWVNDQEHGGGPFTLGMEVNAVKTPPVLCFMTDTWLVLVQWSCQYKNEEWEATMSAFFEFAKKEGATYGLAFTCQAGKLEYQFKP